jgi:D-3-phosphoglycerate dehydrogenase
MKVVVTDYIESNLDWEAGILRERGIDFACHQLKFRPEDEVVAACQDADVIVVNMVKITEALLARLPRCKLLIRHGIGYDNVDVAACTRHGVVFAYQPDYCKEDVAEHAIALLFACARKVVRSRRTLEASSAQAKWDFTGLFPIYRLDGKTVGIVGVGRIGSRVWRKLRSFGFRFLGCDPYLDAATRAEYDSIQWVDKETLFRQADFVTVHTPLNDETRNLVDAEALSWMKPTAYLINTSRGPMVNIEALAAALTQQRIAGAAIDVFHVEPPPPELPLFGLETCILTPHIGWASEEAGQEIRESILRDILAFHEGRPARCVVNQG